MTDVKKIKRAVDMEWGMFTEVHNIGGRANCQDNSETFRIMRESQFSVWGDDALDSYYRDLKRAESEGRNLLAEKYGYMMKDTDPENYKKIEAMLPDISDEKESLVDSILEKQEKWTREFGESYPWISRLGRPMEIDIKGGKTSVMTYARGEYYTYSENTLHLLENRFRTYMDNGINAAKKIVEAEVRAYGFNSLDEAEARLKNLRPVK